MFRLAVVFRLAALCLQMVERRAASRVMAMAGWGLASAIPPVAAELAAAMVRVVAAGD